MNGSGLHGGGGGAGGGYVPSQGWEFVPCAGMDRAERGRGSGRSLPRRISSPPAAFTQLCEPHELGAPPGRGDGEPPGTQLEILDGQMWPRPEPPQQPQPPQTQHTTRLKRKFDELKKRHVQDKEDWMREKESLLREVADIQVIWSYVLCMCGLMILCFEKVSCIRFICSGSSVLVSVG